MDNGKLHDCLKVTMPLCIIQNFHLSLETKSFKILFWLRSAIGAASQPRCMWLFIVVEPSAELNEMHLNAPSSPVINCSMAASS